MPGAKVMRNLLRFAETFFKERDGVALVEFAWIFPVMMAILYGSYNLSLAANASRQLSRLSDDIAQMLVELPQSTGGPGAGPAPPYWCTTTAPVTCAALEDYNLAYAHDSAMLEFPQALVDAGISWASDVSISMAGVAFAPQNAGCLGSSLPTCYSAFVVWYSTGAAGAAARTCSTPLASTLDATSPSPTTLPDDLYTPTSVPPAQLPAASTWGSPLFQVVVDVSYNVHLTNWKPFGFALNPITLAKSSYLSPRYVTQIVYKGTGGLGIACPKPAGWPTFAGAPAWPS